MALTVINNLIREENKPFIPKGMWGNKRISLAFHSQMLEGIHICKTYMVDDDLKPVSPANSYEIDISIEEYHKSLRVAAVEADTLITAQCTDPEWNPEGYSKTLEDFKI